jgi:hypothetical protein
MSARKTSSGKFTPLQSETTEAFNLQKSGKMALPKISDCLSRRFVRDARALRRRRLSH